MNPGSRFLHLPVNYKVRPYFSNPVVFVQICTVFNVLTSGLHDQKFAIYLEPLLPSANPSRDIYYRYLPTECDPSRQHPMMFYLPRLPGVPAKIGSSAWPLVLGLLAFWLMLRYVYHY
jgi:hypothetical protein